MPVEIRELIIKATVVQNNNESPDQAEVTSNLEHTPSNQEYIVKSCVEKVLEILREKNGR